MLLGVHQAVGLCWSPESSSRRGHPTRKLVDVRLSVTVLSILLIAAVASGCVTDSQVSPPVQTDTRPSEQPTPALPLPHLDGRFDYQLGGAYAPPPGVRTVVRDRTDTPARAGYDICYINGFQTQPSDSADLAQRRPDLLVQVDGKPLVDPGWPDEFIFDTSTAPKRAALAAMVRPWIQGCKERGFDAVEIDNLDSYTRSHSVLTAANNVALAVEYGRFAHRSGLAIAQKNTASQSAILRRSGYDFAVTESCVKYKECGDYTLFYPVVLDIEYTDELETRAFDEACVSREPRLALVLRDHDLTTPRDRTYYYRGCPI